MEMVTLKDGTKALKPAVAAVMVSLRSLLDVAPTAFVDLVEICRDADYQPFGDNAERLMQAALMQSDGSVYSSIKSVVLSAVEGEGLDMRLVSPVA